jgi:hypothetical protein
MSEAVVLTPFDGRAVLGTGVSIQNAGDGLSKAMKVDPKELHHDQEVTIAVRCVVKKVRFDPVEDTEGLLRVHVLKAGSATIIDDKLVADAITAMELKIEEAAGVQRLPLAENGAGEGEGDGATEGDEQNKDGGEPEGDAVEPTPMSGRRRGGRRGRDKESVES